MTTLVTNQSLTEDRQDTLPVRKRTRATADQLSVLEETFAINVSPNSKLRKQLAEQLEMSERSIQIWFQNRRAKVKHMQKRAQMQMHQASVRAQLLGQYNYYPDTLHRSQSVDTHLVQPYLLYPQHSPCDPHDVSLNDYLGLPSLSPSPMDPSLILAHSIGLPSLSPSPSPHALDPHTIDPSHLAKPAQQETPQDLYLTVSALTIGTWHRLKIADADLVCVFCPDTRTFAWHILDGGCHFKIQIALDAISNIDYHSDQVHFEISEPPLFYMQTRSDTPVWVQCSDFTEGKQASRFFRHTLQASPLLRQELFTLTQDHPDTRRLVHFLDSSSCHLFNQDLLYWPQHSLCL